MSVTIGQAVLLGVLQGLTEFLPVSMRLMPFIGYCALLGLTLILFADRISSGFVGEIKVLS